ncbi:MAG: D-serine deaminase-like pyridoxal phosphate-dependent protein [Myxococcota bacterium]|jgi:D-serine deaminase-like pyridoxal phosphate-dependent protein
MVVDLEAVDANLATLLAQLPADEAALTLRPATKSLRIPAVMRHLGAASKRLRGWMTFSAHETAWLHAQGFDDFLLAYPIGRADEATALAKMVQGGATLTIAVDCEAHVTLLADAARTHGVVLGICLDLDAAWRPLGGRLHFGVRRSPLRTVSAAVSLAACVRNTGVLKVRAVLAYEAQVAGIRDVNPGSRHLDLVRRLIKRRSRPLAATRRSQVVAALRQAGHTVTVVNGGGTGSLASTSTDGTCTEVTAGSGFLCPHLFDGYAGLALVPAVFFALPVTRTADPGWVTCASGGYIASGATGVDRAPIVHLPNGLSPEPMEGFGEVQTPFRLGRETPRLSLGDPVLLRHAKSGELAERFDRVLLVRGDTVIETARTYRGHGQAFG